MPVFHFDHRRVLRGGDPRDLFELRGKVLHGIEVEIFADLLHRHFSFGDQFVRPFDAQFDVIIDERNVHTFFKDVRNMRHTVAEIVCNIF